MRLKPLRKERGSAQSNTWASIPKVVGSIPTVAGIFFKLTRCGYTLRVTSQTSLKTSWKHVYNVLFIDMLFAWRGILDHKSLVGELES